MSNKKLINEALDKLDVLKGKWPLVALKGGISIHTIRSLSLDSRYPPKDSTLRSIISGCDDVIKFLAEKEQ